MTRHLTESDTLDFVRGAAAPAALRRIEQHLASGCGRCEQSVTLYRSIAATARGEARWDPPAAVLERAGDILEVRARRAAPLKRRLIPRLVFDSFRQPLPAGVRATRSVSRHVLYRAGDFFVDLRIDAEHGARRVSIVGQIAQRKARRTVPPESVSVLLIDSRTVVARPAVNSFGEFHCDFDSRAPVRLRIQFGAQRGLEVPLMRLLKSSSKT